MGKLSIDMIIKSVPGQNKRRTDESISHYLNRLTHIYVQDKIITEIDPIPICKNLTVIYLYDNNLTSIENLEFAPNLTHLYLQNNQIKRMENLNNLKMLTKLHIGGNRIKLIEGLENLTELEELDVDNQILPSGEKLVFEPRTLLALSNNLKVLNVSGNNLDSLSELGSLVNLEQLIASNNNLADMKEMSFLFKCWPRLWKLELNGNLLCLKNKYRERIIVLAPNLETLDGKEIQEMSRQFLQNWKNSKEVSQQRNKQEVYNTNQPEYTSQPNQTEQFKISNQLNSSELPRINNMNSMPTYVMPEGYQILVPAEYRKKQMILYPKQKNSIKLKPNEINGNSLGYNNIFNYNMTTSLQSIVPSSVKTNGFLNRGINLSAKHKSIHASMRNTNSQFIEELRNNLNNNGSLRNQLHSVSALTSNKIGTKLINPLEIDAMQKD